MSTPGTLNFTHPQGSTLTKDFTITDSGGSAVNISSKTYAGQIRRRAEAPKLVDFTTSVTDGANGVFQISLTAAQTAALPAEDLLYDIEQTTGATVERIIEGVITISPEVTK